MMFLSHTSKAQQPRSIAFAGGTPAPCHPAPLIDFGDPAMVSATERAIRGALGFDCTLELTIDTDIWAFRGDGGELCAILAAIVRDACAAMHERGTVYLGILNVFDRCGGDRDRVLMALSCSHARSPISSRADRAARGVYQPGSALLRAMRFAAALDAECDLVGDEAGMIFSLLHPALSCDGTD